MDWVDVAYTGVDMDGVAYRSAKMVAEEGGYTFEVYPADGFDEDGYLNASYRVLRDGVLVMRKVEEEGEAGYYTSVSGRFSFYGGDGHYAAEVTRFAVDVVEHEVRRSLIPHD